MDVPTTILHVPQGITYGAAAVGFVLMAIRHIQCVVRRMRRNGEPS
jgi:TRAP-type C4-dicarboxylate transport system permease small subunit